MRLFYYCILLFSLVTLGGCINDADPVDDPSGNPSVVVTDGNVMFSFTVPETSSSLGRASAESSDETVPGSENESRIEKVQLYLFHSETKNFIESFEIGVERVVSDQTVTYRSNQKIKVDPGSYDVFAVANRTSMINATSVDNFLSHVDKDSYENGTTDASRSLIMANRAVANLNVVVNTPKAEEEITVVPITLERVVAKLCLARNRNEYVMKDKEGRQYATINLSNYRYFNLSRNFYTFRHVVTLADGSDDTNLVKPDFTCTNDYFGVIPATNGYAVDPYVFNKTVAGAENFTNQDNYYAQPYCENASNNITSVLNAENTYTTTYCLENCMYRPAQNKAYATGIVFKASVSIPEERTFNEEGHTVDPYGQSTIYYFNYNFYTSLKAVHDIGKANVPTDGSLSLEDQKKYNIKVFNKSEEGSFHCYYNYFIRHVDNHSAMMGVMEFGIVRNNIYRILITNVNDLGTGIPDVDPGDIESDAYLSVDFSVLPWNIRYQEGEL